MAIVVLNIFDLLSYFSILIVLFYYMLLKIISFLIIPCSVNTVGKKQVRIAGWSCKPSKRSELDKRFNSFFSDILTQFDPNREHRVPVSIEDFEHREHISIGGVQGKSKDSRAGSG